MPRDLSPRAKTFLPSPFLPANTPSTPLDLCARVGAILRSASSSAPWPHRSPASARAASGAGQPQRCARLPGSAEERSGCDGAPCCRWSGELAVRGQRANTGRAARREECGSRCRTRVERQRVPPVQKAEEAQQAAAAVMSEAGARKPSHVLRCDVRQQAMSSTVLRLFKVYCSLLLRDCSRYLSAPVILDLGASPTRHCVSQGSWPAPTVDRQFCERVLRNLPGRTAGHVQGRYRDGAAHRAGLRVPSAAHSGRKLSAPVTTRAPEFTRSTLL